METFAEQSWLIDLEYLERPYLIATGVLETDEGLVLVDPGPTTCLQTLDAKLEAEGASLEDVNAILLTHIHLDHAGATGSIVAENPAIQVYVHRIGARHMINPEKLLASATRLYGAMMDELWGDFLAVPEANVHVLYGAEMLAIGGRSFEVAYTPGHAIHHVSFLDRSTGTAFVGDTAGYRIAGQDYVMPITPPPDIDVDRWFESLDVLRRWEAERIFVTHFGPSGKSAWHLDEMERHLQAWRERVKTLMETGEDKEVQATVFHEEVVTELKVHLPADLVAPYEHFGQPRVSYHGLARYWRKRAEKSATPS